MHIEGMTTNEIMSYLVKTKQETEISYELAESKWIKDNDITVGSRVKILEYNPKTDMELDWNECWIKETMDSFVGDIYSIKAILNKGKGLNIKGWSFPFFVLEKV